MNLVKETVNQSKGNGLEAIRLDLGVNLEFNDGVTDFLGCQCKPIYFFWNQ